MQEDAACKIGEAKALFERSMARLWFSCISRADDLEAKSKDDATSVRRRRRENSMPCAERCIATNGCLVAWCVVST